MVLYGVINIALTVITFITIIFKILTVQTYLKNIKLEIFLEIYPF